MTNTATTPETLGFQTEVKQLLHLMIHSLYSNRDIFLRELVSNASDACDKLRLAALADPGLLEGDPEFRIRVSVDEKRREIRIVDNGIGLDRSEAIANLGTIAKSGTKDFMSRLSGDQAKDAALIGQFGVGFYSAFLVAERVDVYSRRAGQGAEQGIHWSSSGDGEFQIRSQPRQERGTEIVLHLRQDPPLEDGESRTLDASLDAYLSPYRLRSLIRRYSEHIGIPIQMESDGQWETLNEDAALWMRPKSEITDEQYQEFYRSVSHQFDAPLAWSHNRVEGRTEYTQLLYIPSQPPFDLYDRERKAGLKLYIKRVFIMEDVDQLLPNYLRFVRGVVDAADLPLNVSREILQESCDIKAIREGCSRRVLSLLEDLAQNKPEAFATFTDAFGQVLKEGVGEDAGQRDRIAALLRFHSTHDAASSPRVSLQDYIGRMKPDQKAIYVLTGDRVTALRSSPHLEVFQQRGVEVLLLADRVDEWMLGHLTTFADKPLVLVSRGDIDLHDLPPPTAAEGSDAAADAAKAGAEAASAVADSAAGKALIERIRAVLGDRIREARFTQRLTESACCLVGSEHDMSPHMERLLKAAGQSVPPRQPRLELNPRHPLVERLLEAPEAESSEPLIWLLHDQAVLAEGGQPEDPAQFVQRLNRLLLDGLRQGN